MTAGRAIKPVYVLHGADNLLLDLHRREIIEHVLGGAEAQLAVSAFDADAELAAVLDELRTAPFLAPRRLVIIRDADDFVSKHRDALETYLSAPSDVSSLLLTVSSWPGNTRLAKLVARIGQVFECSADEGPALTRRMDELAARRGKKLDRQASELLTQWVGADLAALDNEIEKLSLYTGDRTEITASDVSALTAASSGAEAFALPNAITTGDLPGALKALGSMLTVRGEEFRTMGLLGWHLRRALKAQQELSAGQKPDLRMPWPQQQEFLKMLKRRPLRRLEADFRAMLRADLDMKTGLEANAVMERLVVELCR